MAVAKGRRPTWSDYRDLRRAVDKYFDDCKASGDFPDYAGMLLELQIDKNIEKKMCTEGPDAAEFERIFNIAALRRESWLARTMIADNKKASGCANALKQPENGGYQDKGSSGDRVLKIKVDGINGGLNAMK